LELEAQWRQNDSIVTETLERKNDLESFIYNMRSNIQSQLAEFVKADTIPDFLKQLEAEEMWLYDEGLNAKKNDYVNKIN